MTIAFDITISSCLDRLVCLICPCVLSVTPVTIGLDGSLDHWRTRFVIGGVDVYCIMLQVKRGADARDLRGNPCDSRPGLDSNRR